MSNESGGKVPVNVNQGIRAEYVAQYIMSALGPCERVMRENDYGIDMYCNLMEIEGSVGYTGLLYGIQVKSGNEEFKYNGDHLSEWIKGYNIPLFMCRVNRTNSQLKLFATWMLNNLILQPSFNAITKITFVEDYDSQHGPNLSDPKIHNDEATIWMGCPIIDICVSDLSNNAKLLEYRSILKEWVSIEVNNYANRNTHIPIFFGYKNWITNQLLSKPNWLWYKPYHFGPIHSDNAIKRLIDSYVVLSLGNQYPAIISKLKEVIDIIRAHNIALDFSAIDQFGIK